MLDLTKYETLSKKKAPNSPIGEQLEIATKIVNKPFPQIAGLTKHLSLDQLFLLNKESKNDPRLWWYLYKQKYALNNMTILMKQKLEKFPVFRERKNRDVFLAKWALRDVEVDTQIDGIWKKVTLLEKQSKGIMMSMAELGKFGLRFSSLDRDWRDTLSKEENAHLRGFDYEMKDILEDKKLTELGYK